VKNTTVPQNTSTEPHFTISIPATAQHSKDSSLQTCDTPPTRFGLQWPSSGSCLSTEGIVMANYNSDVQT